MVVYMQSLALNRSANEEAQPTLNFESLLRKLDHEFSSVSTAKIERFQFSLDDLNFDIRRINQEDKHRFIINAVIGYLPFSIESSDRREAIKTIVTAARTLPNVRFTINASSKISAGAVFDMDDLVAPDFIFYPLMLFLQEARPFVSLIGKFLLDSPEKAEKQKQ